MRRLHGVITTLPAPARRPSRLGLHRGDRLSCAVNPGTLTSPCAAEPAARMRTHPCDPLGLKADLRKACNSREQFKVLGPTRSTPQRACSDKLTLAKGKGNYVSHQNRRYLFCRERPWVRIGSRGSDSSRVRFAVLGPSNSDTLAKVLTPPSAEGPALWPLALANAAFLYLWWRAPVFVPE